MTGRIKDLSTKRNEEEYTFTNVKEDVVLSINRDFSAPVIIESNQSDEDLTFLLANDKNSFNRYETAQNLPSMFY